MFQLIVAVISIALVAALAIASIYYGGSAFSKSSLRANVVTLVNGGQQIAGAQALYRTDFGADAGSMSQLTTPVNGVTYLASVPGISPIASAAGWSVLSNGDFAVIQLSAADTTEVCAEVARQAGAGAAQFYCGDNAGAALASNATHFVFKL